MDNEAKKDNSTKNENVIAFDAQGNLTHDVKTASKEPNVDLELDENTHSDTKNQNAFVADATEALKVDSDPEIVPTEDEAQAKKSTKTETVIEDDVVAEDGSPENAIKTLKEKLKKAVAEKQEYLDKWQRDKAEFINIRKRDQESNAQYVKFAKEDLVVDLIPVLDSFEMAFSNKEAWEKVDKNWRIGVEHIYSQLKNVLNNNNLQEISPLGEKFDPTRDEAIEFEPVSEERFDHMITKVIQKGYTLNGKVIKAPKVKVGEFKKA